jgi:hypothetical protein
MANDMLCDLVKEMININGSDRSFLEFGTMETRCTLAAGASAVFWQLFPEYKVFRPPSHNRL